MSGREFTFEIGFEITFNGGKHDFIENESRFSSRMRDLFSFSKFLGWSQIIKKAYKIVLTHVCSTFKSAKIH